MTSWSLNSKWSPLIAKRSQHDKRLWFALQGSYNYKKKMKLQSDEFISTLTSHTTDVATLRTGYTRTNKKYLFNCDCSYEPSRQRLDLRGRIIAIKPTIEFDPMILKTHFRSYFPGKKEYRATSRARAYLFQLNKKINGWQNINVLKIYYHGQRSKILISLTSKVLY